MNSLEDCVWQNEELCARLKRAIKIIRELGSNKAKFNYMRAREIRLIADELEAPIGDRK